MIKFWAIARNTFVQTHRQPIYGVLLLVTFKILILSLFMAAWTMGEKGGDFQESDQKLLIQFGMGSLLFTGLLLASFSASSAVNREVEDRTALTVISKPVSRATFVLGKFAGVAGAVTLAIYLAGLVFLMTVRHGVMSSVSDPVDWPVVVLYTTALLSAVILATAGNIFFGWSYTSTWVWSLTATLTVAMTVIGFVGKGWKIIPFGQGIDPQLLLALLMVYMATMVFVALAVTASTRLGQVLTLLICVGVLFVGSMYSFVFGNWANRLVLAKLAAPLLPNLPFYYALDALMDGKTITAGYIGLLTGYSVLYGGGILALGLAIFQRRELHADSGSSSMPGAVSVLAWLGRLAGIVVGVIGLEAWMSFFVSKAYKGFEPVVYNALVAGWGDWALLVAGGMLALAVAGWIVWTCFGRGVRWAYWLVLLCVCLDMARYLAGLILPQTREWTIIPDETVSLVAGVIVDGILLLVLLLPSTRHHFRKT